jgi:fibronectin-binding autotransporter adhesin
VTKAGTGTWTLSGTNTYTGATNINAGTLAVGLTGSISASTAINVSAGATLDVSALPTGFTLSGGQTLAGGAGTSAGLVKGFSQAGLNSIVAPGLGAGNRGILSITGDFYLNTGSHLALDLAGTVAGTGYDQVTVSAGEIVLDGEVSSLSTLTFTPNFTDVFYIILNNGTGQTFGMLNSTPEGGSLFIGGQEFQVSYTSDFGGAGFQIAGAGNDVALMAVPEPGSAISLLTGLGMLLGLSRRRRRDAVQ